MNEQADENDFTPVASDTTTSPTGATSPTDAATALATAHAAPATTCAFPGACAPAGIYPDGRRVLWPMAIGGVSVAFGAMLLLRMIGLLLNLIVVLFSGGFSLRSILGGHFLSPTNMGAFLHGVLGGLLLIAGLLVMRQNRLGPTLHKVYAILALIPAAIAFVAHLVANWRSATEMVYWTLWPAATVMIYPVFLMIWFHRLDVMREVALWRLPPAPASIPDMDGRGSR